jgi:hypothetical protein
VSERKVLGVTSIPAPDHGEMFDTISYEEIAALYGVDVKTVQQWARRAVATVTDSDRLPRWT